MKGPTECLPRGIQPPTPANLPNAIIPVISHRSSDSIVGDGGTQAREVGRQRHADALNLGRGLEARELTSDEAN